MLVNFFSMENIFCRDFHFRDNLHFCNEFQALKLKYLRRLHCLVAPITSPFILYLDACSDTSSHQCQHLTNNFKTQFIQELFNSFFFSPSNVSLLSQLDSFPLNCIYQFQVSDFIKKNKKQHWIAFGHLEISFFQTLYDDRDY